MKNKKAYMNIGGLEMWMDENELVHIRTPDGKETMLNEEQAGKLQKYLRELKPDENGKINVNFREFGRVIYAAQFDTSSKATN